MKFQRIEMNGGVVKAEVRSEHDVKHLFEKSIDTFGTIHVPDNNAGIQKDVGITEMSLKDWQIEIDINHTGQFLCLHEAKCLR